MTDPLQRESLRHSLLRIAAANTSRWGLTADVFAVYLVRWGFHTTTSVIEPELLYLADKGLLTPVDKLISPEVQVWRITAAGRDQVAHDA